MSDVYKKFIYLFTVLLCSQLFLLHALAAEDIVQIGGQGYSSLTEAAAAAQPGDTMLLLTDCTLNASLDLPPGVTLDGDGYTLALGGKAKLCISGDFEMRRLLLSINRHASRIECPLVISGSGIDCTLDSVEIDCPNVSRVPNNTVLVAFSASDSTLTLDNCRLHSAVNHTTAVMLSGDCADSTAVLSDTSVQVAPQTDAPRSCFGIQSSSEGVCSLSLDHCQVDAPTAAIAVSDAQDSLSAVFTGCELSAKNPLYISGTAGDYQISGCTLQDHSDGPSTDFSLLCLSSQAQDNQITITGSQLDSVCTSQSACAFSMMPDTQNTVTLEEHSSVSFQSDNFDLVHQSSALSSEPLVTADDSVDLSQFPVTWFRPDGTLCNASTSLADASAVWESGDQITLRGEHRGALDLQVPVTLTGEEARFSGSLAIRDPGVSIHGLDLSQCTVDCALGCDLSYNYWGDQPFPDNTVVSPYYADADMTTPAYAPVTDQQAETEIRTFLDTVQELLEQSIPDSTLESFDPETAGDALYAFRDELLHSCERLSQTTTAAQREHVLEGSPALRGQMQGAWRVYWSGVGAAVQGSVVTLSPTLSPSGDPVLRDLLTQNPAAQAPASSLSVDGCTLSPDQPVTLHSTLTAWAFDDQNRVRSMTFQCQLQSAEGFVTGDARYPLPLPSRACEALRASVNGVPVPAALHLSPDGLPYTVLTGCGTVILTLLYPDEPTEPEGPTEPETPTDPDRPPEPEIPDEQVRYTVSLSSPAHGTLRLRTDKQAPEGSAVRITVTADKGYLLDTLDVVTAQGRSVRYEYADDSLRFSMPGSDVRVKARFSRTPREPEEPKRPDPLPSDLPAGAWYLSDVDEVLKRGWMTPLLTDSFCPELPASRGDLITALYRMAGKPDASALPFTDIPPDSAYYAASCWARASGIAQGEPDGRFRPYDPVTREECLSLLYRFCGSPAVIPSALPFSDDWQISPWARPALCWAYQSGVLYGNAEGTCTPSAWVSRAETASLLLRL